jgi:predicted nucleotidyltransferase
MFGSGLSSDDPGDIDLLLVFAPTRISFTQAIQVRKRLTGIIERSTGLPADILLLTVTEAHETQFVRQVRAVSLTNGSETSSL